MSPNQKATELIKRQGTNHLKMFYLVRAIITKINNKTSSPIEGREFWKEVLNEIKKIS